MMSTGNIQRYRNYSALMHQHEQEVKMKRTFKVFLYFLIIAFVTIILLMVLRWEQKQEIKNQGAEKTEATIFTVSQPVKV
ncbi:MAG: hypothetical protein JNM57_12875 [Cyclobacteriaceae bacterium]|nr:hypothetical protein [Cyclobacteriaceae bacterium]